MSLYEWLLFFHVLGAFAMVGAMVFYWGMILLGSVDPARPSSILYRATPPADIAVAAGSLMTIGFGIWLTLYVDGYELWDAWILAAIVLWAVSVEAGRRAGKAYVGVRDRLREREAQGGSLADVDLRAENGVLLHAISSAAVLVALILMIWKPGS